MSRPSIIGLADSTIQLWRATITRDAAGIETRTYHPFGSPVDAVINRSQTSEVPSDAGLQRSGLIRWYGVPTIDVRERDVCQVITGPDAGASWEVNERPTRPRNHHVQVDCIEFVGVLPIDGALSDA